MGPAHEARLHPWIRVTLPSPGRTGATNCHYRDEYDEFARKSPSQLNAISSHYVTIPSQKKVALSYTGLLSASQAKQAEAAVRA
jgi:hypothetical protein